MARTVFLCAAILVAGIWLNNTSLFFTSSAAERSTRIIAHRGVHQIHTGENRTATTCRAESVKPIRHRFVENTLPSMQAAFDYGADVVELDVHLTTDNILAVFHDWTLDCQTNGQGVTNKQSLDYLQSLDLGYGFTDDGETYPLRGTTSSRIPRLTDVFDAGMPGKLLVNFKSGRHAEGLEFLDLIADSTYQNQLFGVYGGKNPLRTITERTSEIRGFDRASLKSCFKAYLIVGWTGFVPSACRNTIIAIPMNYAPFLWGWPHRLTDRMSAANTQVILWGPYDGSGFSSGIDDAATLSRVPDTFDGYLWTNAIETIGPLVRGNDRFR